MTQPKTSPSASDSLAVPIDPPGPFSPASTRLAFLREMRELPQTAQVKRLIAEQEHALRKAR